MYGIIIKETLFELKITTSDFNGMVSKELNNMKGNI